MPFPGFREVQTQATHLRSTIFKQVLHTIPSGIFHENKANVIGNGVVLDPSIFKNEIESLKKHGLDLRKNLYISKKSTSNSSNAQKCLMQHQKLPKATPKLDQP